MLSRVVRHNAPGRMNHADLGFKTSRAVSSTGRRLNQPDNTKPYTERQKATGRPVSPHVSIYAFPPAALSSIANRATGVALTVGMYGIAGAACVGADPVALATALGQSAVGPVAKFAVSFPLIYHYLAAGRHFAWEKKPELLDTEKVSRSSYALFAVATASSIGLAL